MRVGTDEVRDVMAVGSSRALEAIVWILDFTLNEIGSHWRVMSRMM